MKKLIVMGAFALLNMTLFSCTADEAETTATKTEIKNDAIPVKDTQATGPDDDPVVVPPPPKKP